MDEPNANLDEVGESALAQAITYLKSQGSAVIITTHRPRLVSVADNLLVLRNGSQVGFGPADEMINAVRNLQVVAANKPGDGNSQAEEVVAKEATNDAPITASADNSSTTSASIQQDQASEASVEQKPAADVQADINKPSSSNTPGVSS
jgi:ABC-type multidrug transport system ATPase subunit